MKAIFFNDDTYLLIHSDTNLLEVDTLFSGINRNSIIALNDTDGYHGFKGTKTDLDGNTWVFNDYTVTINNTTYTWNSNYRNLGNVWYLCEDSNDIYIGTWSQTNINRTPLHRYQKSGGIGSYTYYLGYINDTNTNTATTYPEDVATFTTMAEFNRLLMLNGVYGDTNKFIDILYNLYGKDSGYAIAEGGLGLASNKVSINKNLFPLSYQDAPTDPTDPYANAGDSDTGGGGGSWDDGSDPVNIPNLPSVGATNTGFISLFVPSQSQLKQVAEYMWGGLFDLSTYKRLFEDPMDCILGLSVVPVSVPTSGSANITVGNIELSGISLPVASQQYVAVDCGSLTVTPYFGSYLDYEPYTKMALFVPYSGVHTVNADDLMGRTVNLVYHIDILTGSLVAFLKCGDSVLYEFNGACSSNIPVNSINYASTIENAIRIAVNIGTTVATAGASAPLSAGAEGVSQGLAGAQNVARGVSLAGSTADGALSLKPNIDRAGSLGGTTGLLGNQTPYFIITRPRLCKPKDQNKIKGYPAFINYSVSDLVGKGYTEFDTILLQNLYLTDDEKNELESILKGGVYL